MAKWLYCLFDK